MRAAGCEALADAHELAVMGLIEPLRASAAAVAAARDAAPAAAARGEPQVFIGVDAPAFNLGLAARFKARGIAHGAVREPAGLGLAAGRVRTIARRCDLVLCLLPFEPAFYARHAVRAQFVGHPLADQVPLVPDRAAARAALGLAPAAHACWRCCPGSRLGEVQRLAPPFIAAAASCSRRASRTCR